MSYDPFKTQIDLRPYRFDAAGNRITGEFDLDKTPEMKPIRVYYTKETLTSYFVLGVSIGMALFVLLFALVKYAHLS